MKKTLMIIVALLVFVLPLSAYSVDTLSNVNLQHSNKRPSVNIRKNRQQWHKMITNSNVDVVHRDGFTTDFNSVSTTMEQLQNYNKAVIKGTVYNLQKMSSPENMAYTKATIHVDKVLSGDKTLKDKNIYLVFDGGMVSFNHWYTKSLEKSQKSEHELFVKNDEFSMPEIGTKIITGVVPNHLDESSDYNNALKQSGFTIHNSYAIDNPQYNLWIKEPHGKVYRINNPKALKRVNDPLIKQLRKLTTKINQKYN